MVTLLSQCGGSARGSPFRTILLTALVTAAFLDELSLVDFVLKTTTTSRTDREQSMQSPLGKTGPFREAVTLTKDNETLSCLEQVLWKELPILPVKDLKVKNGKNQMVPFHSAVLPHHGDAGNWRIWNRAIAVRTLPLPQLQQGPCSVWEVGANTEAASSREYMKTYPDCQFHGFEPIPVFVQKLQESWKGEDRMHIHAYGLADKDGSFMVNEDELNGQHGVSTYIGDSEGGTIEAKIRNFDHALSDAGGIPTMLDVNCEGCEFDFFMQAKQHGFLEKVPIIQVGWHNYGSVGIGARAWQLCQVRTQLSETHMMVRGLAFGWDRWILKEQGSDGTT